MSNKNVILSNKVRVPCRKIDLMRFLNIKTYETFNNLFADLDLPVKGCGRTLLTMDEISNVFTKFGIKM